MNIREIARLCGVSTATVSRVLNDNPNVKQQTREHVLNVMHREGYTPNAFARGLGLDTMRMIGILCTDISDLYYAKAVSLMESDLRSHGFDTLLCCTGHRLSDKKKYLELLLQKRVDAVVLVGSAFREAKDNSHIRQAAKQVPVVIINGFVSIPNVYCVLCDEKEAMRQNVCLLAERGHREILYVYDSMTYSGSQKLEGYKEGLSACGLECRPALMIKTDKDIDAAKAAVEDALRTNAGISAILTSEDLLAVGAQKAADALGQHLPLIGFNNSLYAQCATPALSSVDNLLHSLCPTATSLVIDLLAGKEAPQRIMMSAKLVERETFRR